METWPVAVTFPGFNLFQVTTEVENEAMRWNGRLRKPF